MEVHSTDGSDVEDEPVAELLGKPAGRPGRLFVHDFIEVWNGEAAPAKVSESTAVARAHPRAHFELLAENC